jgi:hypothetical protein
MSNNDKAGSLLATLRAQSEALRVDGDSAQRRVELSLRDIDRILGRAVRWLEEALGHLQVIRPQVGHHFQLGSILAIDRPNFERGFVTYRRRAMAGHELLEHVEMFYHLQGREAISLRVNPGGASAIEERLRSSSLPFQYQTEQDERRVVRHGIFNVTPTISASVRFQPDYRRQVVEVRLHNVDRFESVSLEFAPERLDEPALEDLLRFVLGESTAFLRRAPLAGLQPRAIPAPQARPAVAERRVDTHGDATVPDFGVRARVR